MNKTPIKWVKNPDGTQGYTWNPITGCLNGCSYCYARKLANGRLRSRYLANKNVIPFVATTKKQMAYLYDNDPFYPRFWEDRLDDIKMSGAWWDTLGGRQAKGIFTCDMSDLFGIGIPYKWTEAVMNAIKSDSLDRFYLLTKQPQNLIKFSPFPDNCWVGVTATDQVMWNEALRYLTDIRATVKYISIEPHLGKIVPSVYLMRKAQLGWIIDGAQTKPYKPPKIEWVEEIVKACDKASILVFLKNNLKPLINSTYIKDEDQASFFTTHWNIRQELPK